MSRIPTLVLLGLLSVSCSPAADDAVTGGPDTGPVDNAPIIPEPFVPPLVEGFEFPVDEATIDAWTSNQDGLGGEHIAQHAWGIWTGLTRITGQTWNDQPLRVFETWDTPASISCATTPDQCPTTPRPLTSPGQIANSPSNLAVTVSYDPTAASYILENRLIDADTLNGLQGSGSTIGRIVMPETSIALKPAYMVASPDDRYFLMKTWSGPPPEPQAWGPDLWPECVWVDLEDTTVSYGPFTPASNGTDPAATVCSGNEPADPENVAPLGAFIHFTLDAEAATTASDAGIDADEGDIAMLVAMHVTSRESTEERTRWTWQSFWWSTNANAPYSPSDGTMVRERPGLLRDQNFAAANYAGCAAYQMLFPDQPKTGGVSTGVPVICYNPHLEAGFDATTDLPFTAGTVGWEYEGTEYAPQFGVETTCMSCHLQAAWRDGTPFAQSNPVGDTPTCEGRGCYDATVYIDMNAEYFQGAVTTDALWSIPDSVPEP
jgi:hypothetical protein